MESAKLGISLERDFGSSVFFRASCGCMSNHHDHLIIVEHDTDIDTTCIRICANVSYCDWRAEDKNLFVRVWSRIRNAVKVLCTGYLKMESDFIIQTPEQGRNYANAILEAMNAVEKRSSSKQ